MTRIDPHSDPEAPRVKFRRKVERHLTSSTYCRTKTRYLTRARAEHARSLLRRKEDIRYKTYLCNACRGWHLATPDDGLHG